VSQIRVTLNLGQTGGTDKLCLSVFFPRFFTPPSHGQATLARATSLCAPYLTFILSSFNFDGLVRSRVHPSIPQGERLKPSASAWYSVRGEVSNRERKGAL